jgi:hypothetical protein
MEISLINTSIKWAFGGAAMAALLMVFATQRIPVVERVEVPQPRFIDNWNVDSSTAIKTIPLTKTVMTETILPTEIAKPEEITPKLKQKLVHYTPTRDVCQRHGMRKVTTRGGRSWRCRR